VGRGRRAKGTADAERGCTSPTTYADLKSSRGGWGSLHSRGDGADSCEQTGLLMQVDVENVHWIPFPHVREERSVVHENRFIGDFHLELHMTGWRGLPFLKMSLPACPRSSHSRRIERMVDGSGCGVAI
jgi:hypothetical protein